MTSYRYRCLPTPIFTCDEPNEEEYSDDEIYWVDLVHLFLLRVAIFTSTTARQHDVIKARITVISVALHV